MRKFLLSLAFGLSVCCVSGAELVRLPYKMASAEEKQAAGCDTVYTMPSSHAEFPGGMDALYGFYFKNLPKGYEMVDNMSANIVLLKLFINDKGEVADAKVLRSFNPDFSDVVVRVAEKLPPFQPARYGGRDVCAYRIIKLYFK